MILKNVYAAFLLFAGAVSASQDPSNQATYDPQTRLLILPVIKVGNDYLSAELVDRGGYQFQLQHSTPYIGIVPASYSSFSAVSGLLNIPGLNALGKNWDVTLQQQSGNFLFSLASANVATDLTPVTVVAPKDRYAINSNGTVTDKETGLQWMRCSLGQTWDGNGCTGNLLFLRAQQAAYEAFQSRFAGHSDWRLPTVDELKTLVYCSSGKPVYWNTIGRSCQGDFQKPTLYLGAFPSAPAIVYWTITPLQADPGEDYNLTVSFNYGHVYYSYFSDAYEAARFVRGTSNIIPAPEYIGGFKE